MARHLRVLDQYLCRLVDPSDPLKRLMVFEPPRHGKSEFSSRYFPAWYLGKHPDNRVILASHTANLASEFSWSARQLLDDYGPCDFGQSVARDKRARNNWQLAGRRGGLVSAGVSGPITGKGANLFIADDLVKNAEEACSPVIRKSQWNWWQSTASNRLEPNAAIVMIETRWHQDTLTGRLLREEGLASEGGNWTVLSFPAIAEEGDQLGRQPGEALWPERWPLSELMEVKKNKTPYWWNAMFQQRPGQYGESSWPSEYFDDIWTTEWPEKFQLSAMALDPAMGKGKKNGDYSAIVFAGLADKKVWIDAWMGRDAPPRLTEVVLSWWSGRKPQLFGCESVGFQELLADHLRRRADELGHLSFGCAPIENHGDKIIRIEARLTPLLSRGRIRLRKGTSHAQLLFDQLRAIPNGDHDDGPDAMEMAVRLLDQLASGPAEQVTGRIG